MGGLTCVGTMGIMPRPRTLIASRIFAPEVAAAAFRQRMLADELLRAGCAVEVLTSRPGPSSPAARDGDLQVSRWPALRDTNGNLRGYVQYLSFDIPLLLRGLMRRPADLYVVEPPPTTGLVVAAVTALRHRPYVWYAADIWSEAARAAAPRPVYLALRRVESFVVRRAVRVLAVSDGYADKVAELGVPRERIAVVGNGVDTDVFRRDGVTVAGSDDRPYFVYAGTMSEWQGAAIFVEALELHRRRGHDTRLVIVGQGTELARVHELATRMEPGAVEVRGLVPPEEAAAWIRGAVAALASIRPGLGYDFARPTKAYAAAACGTEVIFAGARAGRAVVDDGGIGWAVDYDPQLVSEAMDEARRRRDTQGPGARAGRASELASWAETHGSLRGAARRAAAVVMEALAG